MNKMLFPIGKIDKEVTNNELSWFFDSDTPTKMKTKYDGYSFICDVVNETWRIRLLANGGVLYENVAEEFEVVKESKDWRGVVNFVEQNKQDIIFSYKEEISRGLLD